MSNPSFNLLPENKFADTEHQLLNFIDYIDEMLTTIEATSPLYGTNPHVRMSIELLRRHFQSKTTQPSVLIDISGVPYATATRRLNEMYEHGLIEKRARSKSGRSFTLHPSEKLLNTWLQLMFNSNSLVGDLFSLSPAVKNSTDTFFGSVYIKERVAPPLNVLSDPLSLPGGLRMLAHSDPTFHVMNNMKRHFEQVLGCPVRQRSFSLDKLHDEIIQNAQRKTGEFDLAAVNFPWLGEFAEQKLILPLDDLIDMDSLDISDFYSASWHASHWDGRCYGIPVETTSEILLYRTDLLQEHNLTPPSTTHEVLQVAAALHDNSSQRYGIAWNAARGTALGHTFILAMADFGQPVVKLEKDERGYHTDNLQQHDYCAMINTPEGLQAAEYLQQLLSYSPPGILTMSWYERMRCYAEGKAAMAFSYTQMVPYFEQNENSPAHTNTGYLSHPVGCEHPPFSGCQHEPLTPLGGFILTIPSNIKESRISDVVKALKIFTSAKAQRLFIQNGSRGCSRYSASNDPDTRAVSPWLELIEDMARKGALQFWPRPPIPEFDAITQVCGNVMHDMLRGFISPQESLIRAQAGADQIIENCKKHNN